MSVLQTAKRFASRNPRVRYAVRETATLCAEVSRAGARMVSHIKNPALATALRAHEKRRSTSPQSKPGALRVLMLNDVGFRYGAGIAHGRQAESFAMNGWDVQSLSWDARGKRLHGMRSLRIVHEDYGASEESVVGAVTDAVVQMKPDVLLAGNLHGARWPLQLLRSISDAGIKTVAYMHDLHLVTGRCAYTNGCQQFVAGCGETCPTATAYPSLASEKIESAWRLRESLFAGPKAIPLAVNSRWTQSMALRRFGDRASISVLPLGLDHNFYQPVPKNKARRLLGLPEGGTVVCIGAVDVRDVRKGGRILEELLPRLAALPDVTVVMFGTGSESATVTRGFGLVRDERLMPFIYSASDIFVSTAIEEALGQTLLEASSCGVATIAFDVGGIRDVVTPGLTGVLVQPLTAAAMALEIEALANDPGRTRLYGDAGRKWVEENATLSHQARAWATYLAA